MNERQLMERRIRARSRVYRVFDANGVLLYIGESCDVEKRMRDHSKKAPWFRFAANVEAGRLTRAIYAQRREMRAIQAERPLYNIQHAADLRGARENLRIARETLP